VCKKLIKNSELFGKKCHKTSGGIFFDSHCSTLKFPSCLVAIPQHIAKCFVCAIFSVFVYIWWIYLWNCRWFLFGIFSCYRSY